MAKRQVEGLEGILRQISGDEAEEPRVRYEAEQTLQSLESVDTTVGVARGVSSSGPRIPAVNWL